MAAMDMQNALPSICPNGINIPDGNGVQACCVADFYIGKTVFITGGTGFMGKVLVEKLLRACPGVHKIYLLIRPKRGQNAHDRLQQLLCSPLFDHVRKERPNDLGKILPIEGDITQPSLAISAKDREMLYDTVNLVFHSAATVKFDEKLKLSVTINMLGTQRLVELCKRMTHLKALVHVSTAYCNCDRKDIDEVIYPPPIDPEKISSLVDVLDESLVDSITPQLIGNRPNTYTFTKALAENWLKQHKGDLPLVIVRPSIVLSSYSEPVKGWVDNWNGPTGIIAATGKGVFRSMYCKIDKAADFIPVDMVINLMLVSAWKVAANPAPGSGDIPVYNCVSGLKRAITWKNFVDLCFVYLRKYPFSEVTWYPGGSVTSSRVHNTLCRYFLHYMPAYVLDGLCWITGKKRIMVHVQSKLTKAAACLEYFTTQEWNFDDTNVRLLNQSLSESDRRDFCFDASLVNWHEFIESYVLGIRRFIFKEELTTIDKARRNLRALYWQHRLVQLIAVMSLWHFLALRHAPLRQFWSRALRVMVHIVRMLPF